MDPITKLHQQIFNREIASNAQNPKLSIKPLPKDTFSWPISSIKTRPIPDPVKFYRLAEPRQRTHTFNTISSIRHNPDFDRFYSNLIAPPGFNSVDVSSYTNDFRIIWGRSAKLDLGTILNTAQTLY